MSRWPLVGIADLEDRGVLQLGRGKVISKKDLAASPGTYPVYSSAKENDGKFGEYGHYMFDEELITWSVDGGGSLFHRPKHRFSITNVGGFVRVLDKQAVDCRYLFFVLSWLHSQAQFDWVRKAHPSVIRKVYTAFPLPPLEEQKRIVAVLDQAFAALDRARALAEANLADAEELEANASDQIWRSLTANAEVSQLGKLAQFRNGLNFSRHSGGQEIRIAGVGDFRSRFWLPIENLKSVRIDGSLSDDDLLTEGDILAVRSNGNKDLIGRVMLVGPISEVASFSGFVIRIRPTDKRADPSYLCHFMKSSQAIRHLRAGGGGANISNLNQKVLDSLCVPVPSHAVQADTVQQLDGFKTLCSELRQGIACKLADLAAFRRSLLEKAFAGELT